MSLLTTDIYEGAYFLSQDMRLERLWLNPEPLPRKTSRGARRYGASGTNGPIRSCASNGASKRRVVFQFAGSNVDLLRNNYTKGQAQTNVIKYKQSLNELKDRMFNLMRTVPEDKSAGLAP